MDVVGAMKAPAEVLQQQGIPPPAAERLNQAVLQQLNLESVRTRAFGLFKTVARILDEFHAFSRANATPKWQDALGQFSMVNLELYNIVEDIKKVSKAFVVYPKNVNADSAIVLPVMLSTKLLPEMETEDNAKREQLLHGMQSLSVPLQIERLKNRIDMIGAACESTEKVISDARKAYGLGSRQGPTLIPTLDKAQAAKIQEQENQLRAAVNFGEGLRISGDQRHISSLPAHLIEVLPHADGTQNMGDMTGSHQKIIPPSFSHNTATNSGNVMQGPGSQLMGRSAPSPGATPLDSASTPPFHYTNSPRSSANLMNTPSPQQQQAQQQQQQQQQQRQKMMQLSAQQQQQILAQQQLRQSSNSGLLQQQQNAMQKLHDLQQGQTQQNFQTVPTQHQMQYSQSLTQQQFQNRQLQTAMQHNLSQNQINQGNQLRSNLGQFAGSTNNALFSSAQTTQNTQLMSNMSGIPSQLNLSRMQQFGLSSAQRNYSSQIINDQMFNLGAMNTTSMVAMQQQQQLGGQGALGNMSAQNLQPGMVGLPNSSQNPNFSQQRQLNQQ